MNCNDQLVTASKLPLAPQLAALSALPALQHRCHWAQSRAVTHITRECCLSAVSMQTNCTNAAALLTDSHNT